MLMVAERPAGPKAGEDYVVEQVDGWAVARAALPAGCPFCEGTGRKTLEKDGITRVYKCRCQRLPDRIALFNAAKIPARHADCTLGSFKALDGAKNARGGAVGWLGRFRPGEENTGLVFHGGPGRGKTHLLAALVRALIFDHGVEARFVEFTHLLAEIKEGYDRGAGEAKLLGPLTRVPVLAIDELGKGRKTDFELQIIDEIVTRRYNARGTILATTNFPETRKAGEVRGDSLSVAGAETLAERLGDRVYSRLKETTQFIAVVGEDYRFTKGRT